MDYLIEFIEDNKNKTLVVAAFDLMVGMEDMATRGVKEFKTKDENGKYYTYEEILEIERKRLDKIYQYKDNVKEIKKTATTYFDKLLKYQAIDKKHYRIFVDQLKESIVVNEDDLEQLKQEVIDIILNKYI